MTDANIIRADTYLWAIRMFKSRTLASTAIKGGKVKLNETNIKASHIVKIGEVWGRFIEPVPSLSDSNAFDCD